MNVYVYLISFYLRFNKMLPRKHFDKIEKGAIDHISPSSAKPITKDEHSPKKVVEIKENSLDKNTKASDDDDDEYDYYYDDDIDSTDDQIITVTPKTVSNKMRKCLLYFDAMSQFSIYFNN